MPVSATGSIAGYLQDVCHEQHLLRPVRRAWAWRAVALLRLLTCLACWDWATSCERLGAFLRLCAALTASTFHARVGIWWDNPLIIWFSLSGLFPNIFYVYKIALLWQMVQLYGKASTKKGFSQDHPLSLGITLTQPLAESKINFLLNLLQLEKAIRVFLPSPCSETQHFREGIPGLME